jgi:hypothetical protein
MTISFQILILQGKLIEVLGESVFGINVFLCEASSRGSVTLADPAPMSPPIIDHSFLKTPTDATILAEAVKMANDV